ncbi:MAG: hypothetical protein NZM11_11955 [Anaerolineales bacterium]|nr:hypothetical protein [Anaerolineales bacterium]
MIRASEIGEYVYCHRAWWLRAAQGYESANVRELEEGTAAHRRHGRVVGAALALRALALVLWLAALVVLFVSLR